MPVTAGDTHHGEKDNEDDEEASGDAVDDGRGDRVGEGIVSHSCYCGKNRPPYSARKVLPCPCWRWSHFHTVCNTVK